MIDQPYAEISALDIAELAEAWLAGGAASFRLLRPGQGCQVWGDPLLAPAGEQLAAPIRVGGQLAGELRVAGLAPSPAAQARLAADAWAVAQLLQREGDIDQMTAELVDVQDQLLALYDLTQAMRSQLGIGETLRLLASEVVRLVRCQGAVMIMPPLLVHEPRPLADEALILEHFRSACEQQHEIVLSGDSAHGLPAGVEHLCVIPIRVRGAINSALVLLNSDRSFSAPDLKLARVIAEHAGAHVEHALLYQEMLDQARLQAEMDVAHQVQLQMLPQHRPTCPALDVYADSRPAQQVGGDFYDFIEQPDRPLITILGDVSGKGISAALIMGMIHAITNSAARFMPKPTPASVLGRANEYLYDDFTTLDTFATAFVAHYYPASGELHYANAGHSPVIYRPAGGGARLLEADGVPIGVLPMSLCENHSVVFGPGDLLIVATDGFSEATNAQGELFGYERLLALVDRLAGEPAMSIGRKLFEAVQQYAAGHPQSDDQTLVVLKGAEHD